MYIKAFKATIASKHTERAYQTDLQLFKSMTSAPLPEVDRGAVQSFLSTLQDRGEASSTIRRRLSALRSFYKWMRDEGHCTHNPTRDVQFSAPSSDSSDRPLTADDLKHLLASVAGTTKRDARARALILITIYGALRRGPLAALDVENVRPLVRQWVVDLTSGRGRGGYVSIPASAVDAVENVKNAFSIEEGPLWRSLSNRSRGERLSADALYKIVRRSGEEAGLEPSVTIDRLRTAGLQLALAGGARPEDVRAHSRLQHPRSIANHFSPEASPAGLRREVPALIEDQLTT